MAADKYIGTTDSGGDYGDGRSDGNGLEAVVVVFAPAVVMVVVATAAAVDVLAQQAVMEACVLLPRHWHWRQCHRYFLAALVPRMGVSNAWRYCCR